VAQGAAPYGLRRDSEARPGRGLGQAPKALGLTRAFHMSCRIQWTLRVRFLPPVAPQPTGGNLSIFAVTL
jgi:hypothetical protein